MNTPKPINFTVIGGFLGAGKTSLVNRILSAGGKTRFAVMVNDFGALNIDESLITESDGQVMQLANGCICCSLAGGLVEAMISLMQYRDQIDHILIEASGVSNPSRIMDFARIDGDLRAGLTLVLADVTRLKTQMADTRLHETLHDQLSSADIFLLTKTDLATADQISEVEKVLTDHQPRVPIITLTADDEELAQLLVLDDNPDKPSPNHDHSHQLNHGFESIAMVADQPIERMAFSRICKSFSRDILRGKGIIEFTEGPMVWHQTGRYIDFTPRDAALAETDASRLIVIALDQPQAVAEAFKEIGFKFFETG